MWTSGFISVQMLRDMCSNTLTVDLLANDMWAMGVVLVFLLTGHLIFGTNDEDDAEAVSKYGNPETQLHIALIKVAQWVSLLTWKALCKNTTVPK